MRVEETIHRALILKNKTLALAESCTGGALAARLTALAGASTYFLGSLVLYSNEWKEQFLGVLGETLRIHGAVSHDVVKEMVQGLFLNTKADYAIAVSGIAGPTGGSNEKPVGTIFIAVGARGGTIEIKRVQAPSPRDQAIEFAVNTSLDSLCRMLL